MDDFSGVDYAIGAAYLVGIPLVGILVGRRERDLGEYFLGGRQIPWWAVWLSILAAEISAVTFIAVPAFAYRRNWTYVQPVFGTIIARVVIAFLFIKPFFDLQVTTVYSYLEKRFGRHTRYGASLVFLVTRVLASGVRLYGGACVISLVAGKSAEGVETLPVPTAIALLAGVTCAYTLVGGIKAVVATDSIQVLVMFAGAIASAAVMLYRLGGIPHFDPAEAATRMQVFDLSFDPTSGSPTLWGGIVGGAFLTMASHGTDQDIVQRLLTAKDIRSSRRALIASGILDLPIVLTFLSIGTLLLAYLRAFPDPRVVDIENAKRFDDIFPYFIAHHLPHGLAGLVIAGVLSVAMGSLSAAMNALASTAMLDLWKPYVRPKAAASSEEVLTARVMTLAFAVLLGAVALVTHRFARSSGDSLLLDLAFNVMGCTYGALLGVFLRGFLTKSGGDAWNLLAMAVSIALMATLAFTTKLHWTWFVPIGAVVTFTIGALTAPGTGKSGSHEADSPAKT